MSDNQSNAAPVVNSEQSEGQVAESAENSEISEENQAEAVEAKEAEIDADPNLSKKEKQEAKKMLKKLKIKFNGREYDEELPFEIPDDDNSRKYMTERLQMAKLAQYRSQEKATLEKQVESFVEMLRKDPKKALAHPSIGVDIKKLAAEIIEEELENQNKTPEQLEAEAAKRELKELKEEREREKKEREEREKERLTEQELARIDLETTKALETAQLPKSPYVVRKVAEYMIAGLNKGYNLSPSDVIPIVKEEMHTDLKEMFAVMPEEVVEAIVGQETLDKLRKKRLAKAKSKQPPVPVKSALVDTGKSSAKEDKKEEPKKTLKEFFGV